MLDMHWCILEEWKRHLEFTVDIRKTEILSVCLHSVGVLDLCVNLSLSLSLQLQSCTLCRLEVFLQCYYWSVYDRWQSQGTNVSAHTRPEGIHILCNLQPTLGCCLLWDYNLQSGIEVYLRIDWRCFFRYGFTVGSMTKETPNWSNHTGCEWSFGHKEFTLGPSPKGEKMKWRCCGTTSPLNLVGPKSSRK